MKRIGVLMMILTLAIILFVPVDSQIKFFLAGFGLVGGLVLIGLSSFTYFD